MKKFFTSLLLFFTFVITIFVILALILFLRYRGWVTEFENMIEGENLITSESVKDIDLEERITKFAISSSDTEFLSLTDKEIGSVLFTTLESYIGGDLYLESMYISSEKSSWDIYIKIGYKDIHMWFSFDINKDDIQSAQIYTTSVYVGPFNISPYTDIVGMVNRGIAEAITTLNENGFVGRYIENIELLEDSIVVKGSRY